MIKLNSSFRIGDVEIPHRTVLAPMAGVTNSAFRTIAKRIWCWFGGYGNDFRKRAALQQRKDPSHAPY